MSKVFLFNPYTGTPRHPSDIASDPEGLLIVDDGEPLRSAPWATAPRTDGDWHNIALNTMHKRCHEAADAFWEYWQANGETHKRGYYESTWGAINRAIRMVGVKPHEWPQPSEIAAKALRAASKP